MSRFVVLFITICLGSGIPVHAFGQSSSMRDMSSAEGDAQWVQIPKRFRGIWASECELGKEAIVVTGFGLISITLAEDKNNYSITSVRFSAAEMTPSGDLRLKIADKSSWTELTTFEERLRIRGVKPEGSFRPEACEQLPSDLRFLYGEGVNGILQAGRALSACKGEEGSSCAEAVMRALDVSGNQKLSVAEIARLLRIALYASAVFSDEQPVSSKNVVLPAAASLPLAPLLIGPTISSLDYNADGELSLSEIMHDRAAVDQMDIGRISETLPSQSEVQTIADRFKRLLRLFGK